MAKARDGARDGLPVRSPDDGKDELRPLRGWGKRPRLHRYTVPIAGLDPALDGLRIAHLSDLHVGSLTPHRYIRAAVEMAQAEAPDLVAMTGDYVCYSPRFVKPFGEIISGFTVPTITVLGNHDLFMLASTERRSFAA